MLDALITLAALLTALLTIAYVVAHMRSHAHQWTRREHPNQLPVPRRSMRPHVRLFALVVLFVPSLGCDAGSVVPTLSSVIARVDVGRLMQCGKLVPDYGSAAKCLGAEAATQGLKIALDEALSRAERALHANSPAGADDLTDKQRQDLGAELDKSLDALAVEIAATQTY